MNDAHGQQAVRMCFLQASAVFQVQLLLNVAALPVDMQIRTACWPPERFEKNSGVRAPLADPTPRDSPSVRIHTISLCRGPADLAAPPWG